MSIWNILKGVVAASRLPNLLIIACAQFFAAYLLLRNGYIEGIGIELFWLIVSTLMVAAGGYIINDYYDQKIDMINRPRTVVVGTQLSRRWALGSHWTLSTLAVVIGFLAAPIVGWFHCFSIFMLWYFSNSLKRFFLGKMVIGWLAGMAIIVVSFLYGVASLKLLAFAVFGGGLIWIRELVKDIENVKGSRMHGVRDMVNIWGLIGTKWFIGLLGAASLILLIAFVARLGSPVLTIYYIVLLPLILWFTILLVKADRRIHFRKLRMILNVLILLGLLSMLLV